MAKYKKKPVVIEAEQFMGEGWYEKHGKPYPDGYCTCMEVTDGGGSPHGHIHTLEGPHIVSVGDYIITGVEGECYPCKPGIFEKTYEAVE
ncbi:MAG TPA: hypothetical protein VKA48_05150 [Gammaproteobacteria bacterium]|nr:hypothetical protein [Gammaproteobacteria bacterium]